MHKRLLLIGGGHSHVEVIRRLGVSPAPGIAVTLVSPDRHTAYSGMLPGHIAGHYSHAECHIDLAALCNAAGVVRKQSAVAALDLRRRVASCVDGSELAFDVVAVDSGSTPVVSGIPGADRHGIAIKPVPAFLEYWQSLRSASRPALADPHVVVVGAGAGGIEILLAMQHRIRTDGGRARFTLVSDGPSLLPAYPAGVQNRFGKILQARGVSLLLDAPVAGADADGLYLRDGRFIACNHVLWVTGAAAPAWPRACGLQTDAAGFIAVNRHLQSPSHGFVFAAGDIASMLETPRPKSGVHAVRQGPLLKENLLRALRGDRLLAYRPQRLALALISSGDRHAVAAYGPFAFSGAWVWHWKNRIDSAFMRRYNTTLEARA